MNQGKNNSTLWFLSILTVLIHLIASGIGYGVFRDELYYLACANHLDIGYVDHPPLSIWILAAWKFFFGDSLFSIRFLPAVCSGITTFIVGILAKNFGGQKYAIVLAGLASMFAPILLAFFSIFSMNAFDILLWALVFLILEKFSQNYKSGYWYLLGLIIGLGALNKISMLWLGAGIFVGVLLTSNRTALRTLTPWMAGGIAALLFLPFVIWNLTHDFAHLEFMRNASTEKYASQNPLTFLSGLWLLVNPLAVPACLAGFWLLLARKEFRIIGFAVLTVLAILLINVHSKPEYFAVALTVLFPAGAVQLEQWLKGKYLNWVRLPYVVCLTASGIFVMPLTLDILPVETFVKYQSALGMTPSSNEGLQLTSLPQFYADRFGWENMAKVTAQVYKSLPDSDKQRCLIYGRNYGEAGAIDYFGREFGLPPAISQHNSYWYWSLEHLKQDVTIIVIGRAKDRMLQDFEDVKEVAIIQSEYSMPYENNLPVLICRKLRRPILEVWYGRRIFI
ncbi:MAG: glycosyltransferase family 39 protein [Ignavibacteriales bacterium]|nr:glycosyltransferase family 39 protein [Ignavibacteriales bacterium]